MKKIKFLSLVSTALVGLALPALAGPRGGGGGFGGGGHFGGGGGRVGGFAGGGSRGAPAFYGGGFRGAPAFRGAYFTGRSVGRLSAAPRFYYGGNRMTAVRPHGFSRPIGRYTSPYASRVVAANRQPSRIGLTDTAARRQPNRVGSTTGRNGFRIHGLRRQRAVSRSSETTRPSGMTRTTGIAIGTDITPTLITTGCLFLATASGGD